MTGNQHIPEELRAGTWLRQTAEMDRIFMVEMWGVRKAFKINSWERLNLHLQPSTAHRMLSTCSGINSGLWANMSRSSLHRHKSQPNEGLEVA